MMPNFNGAIAIAAFQKGETQATYGTAETLGANDQIPFISAELSGERSMSVPGIIDGVLGRQTSYHTGKNFSGPLLVPLFYESGIEDLIGLALGFENANDDAQGGSPHNYAAGVYKHLYEIDNILSRQTWAAGDDRLTSGAGGGTWVAADQKVRSFTLGFAKSVSDTRYLETMINSLTLAGDTEGCTASFDLVSKDEARGDYSSSSWSLRSALLNNYDSLIVKPTQLTASISGTPVYVSRWEVVLNNNLNVDGRTVDDQTILEPMRNDFAMIEFTLEIPRYTADTYLDKKDSGNPEYISLEFLGPQIGATGYYYRLGIFLPQIDYLDIAEPNVSGPGPTNLVIKGKCFREAPTDVPAAWLAANSQLNNVTLIKNGPMIVMFQNARSGNILEEY